MRVEGEVASLESIQRLPVAEEDDLDVNLASNLWVNGDLGNAADANQPPCS
ncbi:MAG TPA: hypothetical protein VNF46_01275 [Gammaproteobacteria bacterium]|nr:hypothetical protein [Gammaproteobacteria bacterium]